MSRGSHPRLASGTWLIVSSYGGWEFLKVPWLVGMAILFAFEFIEGNTITRLYFMRLRRLAQVALVASDDRRLRLAPRTGRLASMDFTPEDMEAVRACLAGIDVNVPVEVEPSAAALFLPYTVYRVADVLALPAWPADRLRLVVERWLPGVDVRIERIR
jgi:hypothetical protein